MKFKHLNYYIVGAILIFSSQSALAQGGEAITVGELFTWATAGDSPNIFAGVLYALLGLVGALVTIFGLIGGAVPGTVGYSKIEAGLNRLEARASTLDNLILDAAADASRIQAVETANTNLRAYLRKERWSQFLLAGLLYAILGAFFATMLAQNLLQALVIGAGWTAYLGVLGLKKDFAERKAIKDKTTEKLEEAIKDKTTEKLEVAIKEEIAERDAFKDKTTEKLKEAIKEEIIRNMKEDNLRDLLIEAQVSKAL